MKLTEILLKSNINKVADLLTLNEEFQLLEKGRKRGPGFVPGRQITTPQEDETKPVDEVIQDVLSEPGSIYMPGPRGGHPPLGDLPEGIATDGDGNPIFYARPPTSLSKPKDSSLIDLAHSVARRFYKNQEIGRDNSSITMLGSLWERYRNNR